MQAFKYSIVGLIFISSLAIVGYFTILTEGGPLQSKGVEAIIHFPNADGIKIGNRVTIHGVPYGYVSKVDLVQIDEEGKILPKGIPGVGTKVEITLALKGPMKIYENYEATIKNESLLSGRIISLNPGSRYPKDPKTQELDTDGQEYLVLSDFTMEPNKSKPNLSLRGTVTEDPLVSLSELIAENRVDIRKTMINVASITSKINNGEGTLGRLINEQEMHKNVNTTLTDAQIVLRELREGLEDLREQAPVTSFIRAALSAF
ncbi:MlaD family protein [Leptospira sp. GIMC2001]|uniref:MlaD family protein n=1 Tax=Leptospira sp. GIMC2001 TaxID=1513297 RepID=UPI0023493236|nr:MlaD family protein [Leptospira sp. GIMC2001]WCL50945.1 MlaD family protein [Leptospira sp. GIMC2001]